MAIKRRNFLQVGLATAATGLLTSLGSNAKGDSFVKGYDNLTAVPNILNDAALITVEERKKRVAKAQQLLQKNNIGALILDSGTSLKYFTGIDWWPSERTMVAIIPARGEVSYVCPAFEEGRLSEQVKIGNQILTWQEDENPFKRVGIALNNAGFTAGNVSIDHTLRFFILDGLHKDVPGFNYVSADSVIIPCRMIKSAAELALMQHASDITIEAIKTGISKLKEGVMPGEISAIIADVHTKHGAENDFADVMFGKITSSPHGSIVTAPLKKGDVVLMDCGCKFGDYSSDITRTIVFGADPSPKQLEIWQLEKKAQAAGFSAAQLGATCESVDAAARKVVTDAGFGPGYNLPGIPHRTGHGIGMDGHEWSYMVKGNKQALEPGMCFSIEPTIVIPNEFGVRLEDCVYMTSEGPKWFSQPSPSINQPFV